MGLTLVEKIAARHADGLPKGAVVRAGDFISIRPRHVMTHDNTGAVIPKFKQIGATKIADPAQPVFAIDHDIQNTTPKNLEKYAKIEAFAADHGIDFYPAGTGISHQVMVEQGYVVPGALVVASDSHSNLYGAMAALGTPVVRTDAASIWATGVTWWQVPKVAKVLLKGRLSPGVTGKDVIIALCGLFNKDEVLNHAVEFVGDGVSKLSMSERMTIANMTTEWGALAGVFPFDEVTVNYLRSRVPEFTNPNRPGKRGPKSRSGYTNTYIDNWWKNRSEISADADAGYAIELDLDLATVVPHVSGPNEVKTMVSLPEMERKRVSIQKAYLLSCVNARFEDLHDAAEVIRSRGGHVASGVEFYLAPASAEVQARSESNGDWKTLIDAGAIPLPPGCGACIGLGRGLVQKGETAISATNRNFKGRMGDRDALVYLGSPAVVAASALAGFICAPQTFSEKTAGTAVRRAQKKSKPAGSVEIMTGFPPQVRGRVLFIDKDNLNTDGIYGSKHTYRDDMTPEEMAAVTFENYDPNFNTLYQKGDVVVGGLNFGSGSSREQAATALKFKGIPCVIAASFSETYKRNAFNNGFVVFECPDLVTYLRENLKDGAPTKVGPNIEIDYSTSTLTIDGKSFAFPPLSPAAQELIVTGGAENLVASRLRAKPQ
ncbi:MAG TPA: homoaconitase [Chthoniobacterales bacterium]|jgi:homoaconitate hydratase|nr:homoaconitase [Chthoniobacterales bacterium]